MIFLVILLCIWVVYTAFLTYLLNSWNQAILSSQKQEEAGKSFSGISLVIVARNEEKNVFQLFESISKQLLSKKNYEVIFIDDSSEDNTIAIAQQAKSRFTLDQLQIVSLKDESSKETLSGKKAGLTFGINRAKFPLIAISDADCFLPSQWLTKIRDNYLNTSANVICAPVLVTNPTNTIGQLQEMDFAVTSLINAGAAAGKLFFLGNAANLAFEKEIFFRAGGYSDDNNASGDDVLLLQKIAALSSNAIYYYPYKDSAIYTKPLDTTSDFFDQRLRWASKNNKFKNHFLNLTQIAVYLTNVGQLFLTFWLLLFPFITIPLAVPSLLVVKLSIDYFIVANAMRYYHNKTLGLGKFIHLNYYYAIYISFVATKSLFIRKYYWKGRKVQ